MSCESHWEETDSLADGSKWRPAMSGIIKVIVSCFRKGEEVAIERHRNGVPVNKDKHTSVLEFKKTSDKSFKLQVLQVIWGSKSKTR